MEVKWKTHCFVFLVSRLRPLFLLPSARLSSLDSSELPQPGRPVRPEAAAAGGGAGGGAARGPGGMSAGGGAEGGVWETEGGDEDAAEQPEGQGQCWLGSVRSACRTGGRINFKHCQSNSWPQHFSCDAFLELLWLWEVWKRCIHPRTEHRYLHLYNTFSFA